MENSVKELAKYRYETSLEDLEDAKIMFDRGRYKISLNRGYYSIFHAIRAVNALEEFDSSKHSGVVSYFNQNFVKKNIFPKELSKIIKETSEKREKADYLDFYIASKSEAEKQIERAESFVGVIKEYLVERGVIDAGGQT